MLDLINPYAYAVRIRNWLYDKNFIKPCKLPVPVLSVGNLSVGGSGKSSLVRYMGGLLKDLHVCILSRGYGRRTKGTILASERGRLLVSWEDAGDEPYMLAKLLPWASVVVDENRCRGAFFALERLKPDIFILDDGFQHRRIHRDLNILLLKKKDLSDRLFPFGRLREPLSGMERADIIILSYADIENFDWRHPTKPTLKMVRENWRVVRSSDGKVFENFKETSFIAFAGLGDNSQFFKSLERLGIKTKEKISLPDHYSYKDFKLKEDEFYITTLKDAIKLKPSENLFYLDFDVRVDGLEEILLSKIRN
ncbi:tetraacyldisaccharide 4'-kinase [Thermodesulfovibrio sp.]|jgi:tetraacyldisaccharide 4'-kinase|uniref:tetraacyldisaccharide 4'-kinase n=1 Tax=Pseudomonadati TaxID=3379134 RepID=UPI000E8AC781|nr:tetraacyldisaccharide 4'-kinase [Aquificaceae bacterium]QWK12811.1 MAG: tetraacyldisaccharide 4'-kinase [Aquificota bacterium]HAV40374.1 tetraacyldisaccharide 4'-kinase [Aquificaceae bacterium]